MDSIFEFESVECEAPPTKEGVERKVREAIDMAVAYDNQQDGLTGCINTMSHADIPKRVLKACTRVQELAYTIATDRVGERL